MSVAGGGRPRRRRTVLLRGEQRQRDGKLRSARETLLGEEKSGPGSEPQWKARGTRYPNLYKALLEEPTITQRTKLLEDNSRAKEGDGRIMRRPARTRIRNQ